MIDRSEERGARRRRGQERRTRFASATTVGFILISSVLTPHTSALNTASIDDVHSRRSTTRSGALEGNLITFRTRSTRRFFPG